MKERRSGSTDIWVGGNAFGCDVQKSKPKTMRRKGQPCRFPSSLPLHYSLEGEVSIDRSKRLAVIRPIGKELHNPSDPLVPLQLFLPHTGKNSELDHRLLERFSPWSLIPRPGFPSFPPLDPIMNHSTFDFNPEHCCS